MYVVAIVPAGGSGKRFGSAINKVFEPLNGIPILVRTLLALQGAPVVNEIIPALRQEDSARALELFKAYDIDKVQRTAPGGSTRQESVFNALKLVDRTDSVVLIHDAARPLVSREIIEGTVSALDGCDGTVCAVKVKDTVKETSCGLVVKTLTRDNLAAVQTPQVFRYDVIMSAYRKAFEDNMMFTDDTSAVEYAGGRIKVVAGSYQNLKITTPDDMQYAGYLLASGSFLSISKSQ